MSIETFWNTPSSGRQRSLISLCQQSGLLVVLLVLAVVRSAAWAQAEVAEQFTIGDALPEFFSFTVTGSGRWNALSLEVANSGSRAVAFAVPSGTVFDPLAENYQRMISLQDVSVSVAAGETRTIRLPAACVQFYERVPARSVEFTLSSLSGTSDLDRFLADTRDVDVNVRQLAVWLLTDDLGFSDFDAFYAGSNEYSSSAALRASIQALGLLSDAGFDLERFRLFRDEPGIRWDMTQALPPNLGSSRSLMRTTLRASLDQRPAMFRSLLGLELAYIARQIDGMPITEAATAYDGALSVLQELIDRGADIDAQDSSSGDTLLHRAAREAQTDVIDLLLANGANPEIENNEGVTASMILAAQSSAAGAGD